MYLTFRRQANKINPTFGKPSSFTGQANKMYLTFGRKANKMYLTFGRKANKTYLTFGKPSSVSLQANPWRSHEEQA